MLILGFTFLDLQNFSRKHESIYLVLPLSTPKITSCPENMSKYESAGFQVDKSQTDMQ